MAAPAPGGAWSQRDTERVRTDQDLGLTKSRRLALSSDYSAPALGSAPFRAALAATLQQLRHIGAWQHARRVGTQGCRVVQACACHHSTDILLLRVMQLFQMEDGTPAASSSGGAGPSQQPAAAQQNQQRQPDFGSAPAGFGAGASNTLDEPLWVS